jgi:hypothetical protein
MSKNKIQVSQELLERANQVREYVAAINSVIKELEDRNVDIEFYINGNKISDCLFGLGLEIRMHLPMEPIVL